MDPKLSGLDPKLREAYERVMNGPTSPGSPTPPTNPQTPAQQTPPAPQAAPTPASVNAPAAPASTPAHPISNPSFNSGSFNTAAPTGTTTVKKAGGKMSTILIILGLIVLLIAYTFVWVYLFDLKIPFLPF